MSKAVNNEAQFDESFLASESISTKMEEEVLNPSTFAMGEAV